MDVKKDIGKVIREKLDNLDRMPGDALWNSISKELDQKKKKKFPFFWVYIFSSSLVAITVAVYVLSNVTAIENNASSAKQDGQQNNATTTKDSLATTASERSSMNGTTLKDSSANGTATSQNKGNDATDTDATTTNITESSNARNNNKTGNTGQTVISVGTTSKNSGQKNNTTAGRNRKDGLQNPDGTTTHNNKATKSRNNKKNYPTASYTVTTRSSLKIDKENTVTDPPVIATISDKNEQKTASKTAEQKTVAQNETQTANSSENSNTSLTTKTTGTEIVNKEQIIALDRDSLPESALVIKDSIKTEVQKEEVAEEKKEENKKDSIPPVIIKKFSVFAYGGPSYFSFPDKKIVTDSTTSNINTKSSTRFGVLFGYRLNNKLSIRTGLSFYKLKQSANNIKLNYVMGGDVTNPGLIPTPDFLWIDYKYPFGVNNALIINTLGSNYQAIINIDRELSYLEIPMEISYNLYDKRFGISLTGGGSMLLLNKNKVFAYNENGQMHLGEWNAAAKTSFTGSLGLGLYYKLTPSLQVNTEPIFNYYFNTYNDSNPYSFTIRLGLQYNFDF